MPSEPGALAMRNQGGSGSSGYEGPAFCVGAPKSGTHSIAELFGRALRTAHEPHAIGLVRLILADPRPTPSQRKNYFHNRNAQLQLQLESTHLLVFFLDELLSCFPEARFILTVRDPKSWLDSMFNQQLGRGADAEWRRFYDYRFGRSLYDHFAGAEVMKRHGLYPLDSYLAYWAWHNEKVLRLVPAERLVVVPTRDIEAEGHRLASFLGADPALLAGRNAHAFPAAARFDLVSKIDPHLLEDRIAAHCNHVTGKIGQRMRQTKEPSMASGSSAG